MVALLVAPAVAAASGSGGQVWVTNCTKEQYKPRTIVTACGDGSAGVIKLKWSSWSRTRAAGSGTEVYDTCNPNCAAGKTKHVAATVTLSKPVSCRGRKHRVFKILTLHFRNQHGPHSTQRIVLGCPIKLG